MTISEKAAYIKGLMEGMNIDTSSNEGKLFAAMADLLEDMALTIQDLEDENATLNDYIEEIDEDLGALEEDFYECGDDCDCCDCDDDFDCCDCEDDDCCDCDEDDCCDCCECLELECPVCANPIYIDEDDVEEIEELECPSCGKVLALAIKEDDEADEASSDKE